MVDVIRHMEVEGVSLGYSVHGEGSKGPPIVFAHGLAMRSTAGPYEELLELLSRHGPVYALDLRGHGARRSWGGRSISSPTTSAAFQARWAWTSRCSSATHSGR